MQLSAPPIAITLVLVRTALAQSFAAMISVVAAHVVDGDRSTVPGVTAPISTGRLLVHSTYTCARHGLRDSFGVFSAYEKNC